MRSVSFIIPTLNEADVIGPTLESIPFGELRALGWNVEVIVADGGSNDGTV